METIEKVRKAKAAIESPLAAAFYQNRKDTVAGQAEEKNGMNPEMDNMRRIAGRIISVCALLDDCTLNCIGSSPVQLSRLPAMIISTPCPEIIASR